MPNIVDSFALERALHGATADATRQAPVARYLLLATLLATPFVFFTTFTGWSWFDDEGTLLIGFRSWLDGGRMYDDIYSLYGPLYNAVYGLLYVGIGVPISHSAGRVIAGITWLAFTAGFSAYAYRLSRSIPVAAAAYVLVLFWLVPLIGSPGHPQGLCLILLAAVLLAANVVEGRKSRGALFVIGVAVAGLALIKINIGAFVGGAVALAMLRMTRPGGLLRYGLPVVSMGLLAMPVAVQSLLLDRAWVQSYALFATLVIAAAALTFIRVVPQRAVLAASDWLFMGLGALACTAIAMGGMLLAGSTWQAMLHAMLWQNAEFIRNWHVPLKLGPFGLPATIASLILALALTQGGSDLHRARVLAFLKLAFAIIAFAMFRFAYDAFPLLVPFCWLFLFGPKGEVLRERALATLAGAVMSLYAFPVAGTQVHIALVVPALMAPLVGADAFVWLRERYAGGSLSRLSPRTLSAGMAALLLAATVATARQASMYWEGIALGLPGTPLLRTPEGQATELRTVVNRLAECSSLYAFPGLWSFSFWTRHWPPSYLNVNNVLGFVSSEKQYSISAVLERSPGLCVLYMPKALKFFDEGQIATNPPLLRYIRDNYSVASEFGEYRILKRFPERDR